MPQPSTSNSPPQEEENTEPTWYLFPDQAILYEEGVQLGDHWIAVDSGELEFSTNRGTDVFRPLLQTPAVDALMLEASLLIPQESQKSHRLDQYNAVVKTVNRLAYSRLGWRSGQQPYSIVSSKYSRFISALPLTIDHAPKKPPHLSLLVEGSEPPPPLATFLNAPKLARDCHKLKGILMGITREIPEDLRSREFELRQQVAADVAAHEFTRLNGRIISEIVRSGSSGSSTSDPHYGHWQAVERISAGAILPTLQANIANGLYALLKVRDSLRNFSTKNISSQSIRLSLCDGELATPGLFAEKSVRLAEECYKASPAVTNVTNYFPGPSSSASTSFAKPYSKPFHRGTLRGKPRGTSQRQRGSFRGPPAGRGNSSSSRVLRGSQQRGRGSQQSYRQGPPPPYRPKQAQRRQDWQ